jgi:hypothetical protein
MIRIARLTLALSTAAALLSGCAGMITGGPLIRPGEPTGVISVVNQTRQPLGVVLISDCNASTYGLNRLPDGVSIPQGRSYQFQVSAGCWDVAAGALGVGDAKQRMNVVAGGTSRYTVTQ